MKYLIVGDPHAKPSNLETINQLLNLVESLGYPTIFLGDLLDTKELVRASCLNTYYKYFKSSKLEHILLVGNHDLFNLDSEEHSLETLKELSNVTVVDGAQYSSDDLVYMPYVHSIENLKKDLDLGFKKKILFAHLEVKDFDYGNGHICESGLTLEDLKDYELVISGHFHKHQTKGNLVYLGTPFSHSFGEANQDKFLAVLDTETLKLEYIGTPFPRHISLDVDCNVENPMANLKDQLSSSSRDSEDHVRVILKGTEENVLKIDKTKYPEIKFIEETETIQVDSVKLSESATNEEFFSHWASEKALEDDTRKLGLELLRESK